MDRITRIYNIIKWQGLYQEKKDILAIYEEDEQKLSKLQKELNYALDNQVKSQEQNSILSDKIELEEKRLDDILNKIDIMEKDRDNLKMARQIKSWEKDIEKFSQDREIIEAQLYYDKSKIGDITQELDSIVIYIETHNSEIKELETKLFEIRSKTKNKREKIKKNIEDISLQFDTHFVEYFNRLLIKNKGIVMAMIEEDSCSGCNILLPTSYHGGDTIQDTEDSALLQCPNCFRYLYYNEDI